MRAALPRHSRLDLHLIRWRLAPAACLALAVIALVMYAVLWLETTSVQERGSDFSASYTAALLLREGQGSHLYDEGVEAHRHAQLLPDDVRVDLPFITPPTTALLTLPLTEVGPGTAYRAFALVQLLLLAGAVAVALRAAPWPSRSSPLDRLAWAGLALAGVATLSLILLAQWDGLVALGLALSYAAWRGGHPGRAAFSLILCAALAKPHLALGLVVYLLARREKRAAAGAAVGGAVSGLASLAAVGPRGCLGFLQAAFGALGHTPPASTVGLTGLSASWMGTRLFTVPAAVLSVLALAACLPLGAMSRRSRGRLEISLAGATALSLVASPHLLTHDLVLLAPALCWCAAVAAARDQPSSTSEWGGAFRALMVGWLAFNLLVALDTGNSAPAPPGRVAPLGLLAVGAVSWLLCSRRPLANVRLEQGAS